MRILKKSPLFIFLVNSEKGLLPLRSLFNIWILLGEKESVSKWSLDSHQAICLILKNMEVSFYCWEFGDFATWIFMKKLGKQKQTHDFRGCNLFRIPLCFFEVCTPNTYCCGDDARCFDQQELKSWVVDSLKPTLSNITGLVIPQLLC